MISPRKLQQLPRRTRLRKLAAMLHQAEVDARFSRLKAADLAAALGVLAAEPGLPEALLGEARLLEGLLRLSGGDEAALRRRMNGLRHALLRVLGAEPAEWDLLDPEGGTLDASARTVFPVRVYLEDLRSPYNVGAVFRTAEAFGVERIDLSPDTPSPLHRRALKTARGAVPALPWSYLELSELRERRGVFALEVGGVALGEFGFPAAGTVLIGSEELGVSPEGLALADASAGRVSIPMAGAKRSLNVAVAFGILMHAWFRRLAGQEADGSP